MISFDDPDLPGVSYISQNEEALAQAAVEQLREQIDGDYTPRRTVLPVELILCDIDVRDSSGSVCESATNGK